MQGSDGSDDRRRRRTSDAPADGELRPFTDVGLWLEERRADLGLTLAEAAAMAAMSPKTLNRAELGYVAITTARRAAVEDAYLWERGSLTRAYRRGEKPRVAAPAGEDLLALIQAAPEEERQFLLALYHRSRNEILERLRGAHGLPVNTQAAYGTRRAKSA